MGGISSKSIWEESVSPFEEFAKRGDDEMDTDGGPDAVVAYLGDKLKGKKTKINAADVHRVIAGAPIHGASEMCHSVYPGMGDEIHKALMKAHEKGVVCEPLAPKDILKVYLNHKGALDNTDWPCIAGILEENVDHLTTLDVSNTAPFLHSVLDGKVDMALSVAQWIQEWACHFTKPTLRKIELYIPDAGGDAGSAYYMFTEGKLQVELCPLPKKGGSPAALPTPGGIQSGVVKHAELEIPTDDNPIVMMLHVTNENPQPPKGSPIKPLYIKTFALTSTKNWKMKEVQMQKSPKKVVLQNLAVNINGGNLMQPKEKVEGEYKHCLLAIHGENLDKGDDVLSFL